MLALQCEDVKKSFGSFQALKGVSLQVQEGECFGLLGPNGAGKSTLISMIYGAASRSSGGINVFGDDPQTQGRKVRAQIGVVTQENNLDSSMTVIENMHMFSRYVSVPAQQRQKRIEELLDFMLLSHKSNSVIESLSGGMKRRLVFVRALLHNPKMVILDEPTTGLDPAVRQLLWEKVRELKRQGTTVLLTTHYMDEAERLCDRLVIMDEGLVKAEGTPAKLIDENCPNYFAGLSKEDADRLARHDHNGFTITKDQSNILLGASDLTGLSEFLTNQGMKPLFIRPANLEDVFLKITGRELADND
jgi:lipooligosaccharide transport system ATP-binding protein